MGGGGKRGGSSCQVCANERLMKVIVEQKSPVLETGAKEEQFSEELTCGRGQGRFPRPYEPL